MSPFFSIIVPVYNTDIKKLERCIRSILEQSYQNFELIIVDDGSDGECAIWLDDFTIAKENVRVFRKVNEGSAIARNYGITKADGEYVMFVDSDDAIAPYVLFEAKEIIDTQNPDIVMGLVEKYSENDFFKLDGKEKEELKTINLMGRHDLSRLVNHMLGKADDKLEFSLGYVADGPVGRCIKRSIITDSLFTPESIWNDDTIWNIIMSSKCESVVVIDSLWYAYIINESSKTRKFRENCLDEFLYRTNQEMEVAKAYWPECVKGVSIRIWRDMSILCRTYLFHPQNDLKEWEKIKIFKKAVTTKAYKEALREMLYQEDNNFLKKVVRDIINLDALIGTKYIAYFFWKNYIRINR